jgi:3-methylcrotonyl-CoA carboxylase beta subunit
VRLDQLRQRGATLSPEQQAEFKAPTLERYEHEGSPYFSTARLWDDGVIDPVDTRTALGLGISAALNAPIPPTTFGVFRT